jgi:hypothetical protein
MGLTVLTHETLITFYRGCGWSEAEAIDRAIKYLVIQKKYYEALIEREKMTEEDQYQLQLQETRNERNR